jgi:hypothetical protein
MQDSSKPGSKPASRRKFFFGAATAGATVAAVAVLPRMVQAPVAEAVAPVLPPPPDKGGGYTLSEHVKRYYKTASA